MNSPLVEDQLDDIENRAAHLTEYGTLTDEPLQEDLDRLTGIEVPALLAEVRRLRELEGPAVQARAALAALCHDLEDPGSNAYGALYLLSQATLGINAPKDEAALALGEFASDVLHKVADMADPEPPEVSFFGGDAGPAVAAWLRMLADRKATVTALATP